MNRGREAGKGNRMKAWRTVIAGLACIGVLGAACTAGGGTNTSPPPTINPSVSHQPVTLTIWTFFSKATHELGVFESVISSFEQKYPWITVKTVPDKADTDILNAINAGTVPDVANICC